MNHMPAVKILVRLDLDQFAYSWTDTILSAYVAARLAMNPEL